MNANDLIAEFGSRAGLPDLRLSPEGTASLETSQGFTLTVEHDEAEGVLYVFTTLGPAPTVGREAYFERLLSANLFGRETGGALIGYDPDEQEVILSHTLVLDRTDDGVLENVVVSLIAVTERLHAEVQLAAANQEPDSEQPVEKLDFVIRA